MGGWQLFVLQEHNMGFRQFNDVHIDISGVLMNAAATALHKFVISFSVGIELIANKVIRTWRWILKELLCLNKISYGQILI